MDNFRNPKGNPPNNMYKALIFQAAMAGLCVVLCAVYCGPMKRTEAYREAALAREAVELSSAKQQDASSLSGEKQQYLKVVTTTKATTD